MKLIPIDQLQPDPNNPRKHFDTVKLQELANNIKEQGVLTELWIRQAPDGKGFMIIAGERRYRAAKLIGLDKLPCDVKDWDDKRVAENQIVENLQRDDLNPLEEARAYKGLIDTHSYDVKAVAEKIGKSPAYVYGRFRLLKLSKNWHQALDEGTVKHVFAEVVAARVDDVELQDEILDNLQQNYGTYEADTAEELRQIIEREHTRSLKRAPWNTADPDLLPAAGPCTTCPKRSQAQAELFGTNKKDDFCTDGACWVKKLSAHEHKLVARYKAEGRPVLEGAAAAAALKKTSGNERNDSKDSLVKLDSSPSWYSDRGNLREALKKKVEITLAVDAKGHVHELAKVGEVKEALPKDSSYSSSGGGGTRSGKMTPAEKKARRARLLDLKASAAAREKAWKAVIEKMVAKGLDLPMLRNLLRLLLRHHLDRHSVAPAMERLGRKGPLDWNAGKEAAKWLDTNVSKEQVLTMAWQLALGSGWYAEGGVNLMPAGVEVFKMAGVDWKALKEVEAKRITAEKEAKIKAKLAGIKAVVKGAAPKKRVDKSEYTNVVAQPSDIKKPNPKKKGK